MLFQKPGILNRIRTDEGRILLAICVLVKLGVLWMGDHLIQNHSSWIQHLFSDLWTWMDFVKKSNEGLIPFVDFSKEYPVGAGMIYWVMSRFVPNSDSLQMLRVHAWMMSMMDVVNAMVFYRILRELNFKKAFGLSLLSFLVPTALILSPVRFEPVVIFFTLLGYRSYKKERFFLSTFFWSIGFSIKWFPAFFIAIQEWRMWGSRHPKQYPVPVHALKSLLVFLGVGLAINLPFLILSWVKNGNIDPWLNAYFFHIHRPLYWDTFLGAAQLWLGELTWEKYASLWSLILMIGVLLWKPRMSLESKSTLVIFAALFINRIYSTQFNLWFYPMLLVLLAQEENQKRFKTLLLAFLVLDAVNVGVYPFSFTQCLNEIGNFVPGIAVSKGSIGTVLFTGLITLRMMLLAFLAYQILLSEKDQPASL